MVAVWTMLKRYVPQSRSERLIAISRFALAIAAAVAVYLDPLSPTRNASLAYTLLVLYAVYAFVVMVAAMFAHGMSRRAQWISHCGDLLFFAVINQMTSAATSPFFIYFLFSIVCAMLRFGRRGTILTAVVAGAIFLVSAFTTAGDAPFELNRFVIRTVYLAVVAILLIYLADYQQRIHHDLARIAGWRRSPLRDRHEFVRDLLQEAAAIFGAPRVLLAYEVEGRRCAWLCDAGRCTAEDRDAADLLLEGHPSATYVSGAMRAINPDASDPGGRATSAGLPPEIVTRYGIDSVVATAFKGEVVRGRLILIDGRPPLLEEINMAKIAGGVIASRLDHFHSTERLQRGAVAEDRMRVGRDLHDSVLQSLAGVALQLKTLPQLMIRNPEEAQRRFDEIAEVLLTDQRELRWFIEQLRSEGHPGDAEIVSEGLLSLSLRWRRQWGIEVETRVDPFVHLLAPETRLQVYALVSEAVANAAKHASAKRVSVAVTSEGVDIRIKVDDDGRGFPFAGRYDLAALQQMRQGPGTLKARVASLGGDLVIDSSPAGAHLDIRFPCEAGA